MGGVGGGRCQWRAVALGGWCPDVMGGVVVWALGGRYRSWRQVGVVLELWRCPVVLALARVKRGFLSGKNNSRRRRLCPFILLFSSEWLMIDFVFVPMTCLFPVFSMSIQGVGSMWDWFHGNQWSPLPVPAHVTGHPPSSAPGQIARWRDGLGWGRVPLV